MFEWGIPNATLFFVSLVAASILLWRSWSTRREATQADQLVRVILILPAVMVAIVCVPSLLAVQKWVTKLAMPVGILWLGLILLGVVFWRQGSRRRSAIVWFLLMLLTFAGNQGVSRRLLAHLESEFARIDPLTVASRYEPFDVVLALGGSTSRTAAGQVQVTGAGDRTVLAARLYHAGHARLLAATGEPNVELLGPGRSPAKESQILWQGLGVPRDAIIVLEGQTTKEEFDVLAREADARGWEKIGVVTSAWHMGRAMRLAAEVNLDVHPLPADFIGIVPEWKRIHLVPEAETLYETSRALKEYLARLVGR